jgi:hypothetical protein
MLRFTSARAAGGGLIGLVLLAWLGAPAAYAAELYHDGDLDVRWDNTLQYTAAFRLFPQDRALLANVNWDDGDRNFDPGAISNRLDLFSELEVTDGDYGLRLSGAGWYDTVYLQKNDNDSAATFNPFSVPHNEFTHAVRSLHGEDLELGDAFVHGNFDIADIPASFRAGRYTLLWGESVFFGDNSIAAGQAPTDVIRELAQPESYTKDVFLPVWQSSVLLQPAENISLGAYYQFAWRKDVLPGSGSYFSYSDFLGAGGERIILAPGHFLYRAHALRAPDTGQYGVSLQVSGSEFDYGFYALRFNAKEPQTYIYFGAPSRGDGTYRLVYPTGVELYGASFSTYVSDSDVAGEISFRRNMPLVSYPIVVPSGAPADNDDHPLYAIGDTLHAQVSSDTTFSASPFWQRADLAVELAANERLSITKNPVAIDPSTDRFAMAFQANFTPQYFQVLPALDVSLPIGFGYGLVGNSSTDETQQAHAGNFEIGIAATYRAVWQGSLNYTHFIATPSPARQSLADRDFIALTLRRSF